MDEYSACQLRPRNIGDESDESDESSWLTSLTQRAIETIHNFVSPKFFRSWLLILLGSLGLTPAAFAAVGFVQYNVGLGQTPQSMAVTYTGAQTAGDLNVVFIAWLGASVHVQSVTDSAGNTYAVAAAPTISGPSGAVAQIFYAKNIAAAAANSNSVTVTFDGSAGWPDVRIAEYSGIDTVNPLDVSSGNAGVGLTADSGSVTTTYAHDLLVGGNCVSQSTAAPGPGFTARVYTNYGEFFEDREVTSTGSYSASATNGASDWWIMQMAAFKAADAADTQAPTAPTSPAATTVSSTQINLSWVASTDNVGVTGYRVERCSGASCSNFAQIATPASNSYSDTGLAASTSYSYRFRAADAAGNLSAYSTTATANTQAASDTQAPTAPTGLTATAASGTQINLSWTASTDNVAVTGYRVERCAGASCTTFAQVATPTATSYSDTGVTNATSYSYRVRATDAVGNLSGYSATASAVTPDTQAPIAPTGLSATVASSTQINLTWTASTDNVGVTGYRIERCSGASCSTFAQIATPTTTSYSNTGLTASTSYSYRLLATDAAGNLSVYSSTVSATTQAASDTQAPTAPTGLTATTASNDQINLSWTASTDNVAVTGYRVERCLGASCTTFAQVGTPTAITYIDTGLAASTTYRYRVLATDAAGNLSSYSGIANATTSAQTAVAFVQVKSTVIVGNASTLTATFASAQAAGNLNVVVIGWNNSTSHVTGISDTRGNTYTLVAGPTVSTSNATQSIYYAKNIVAAAANANTVTVTLDAAAPFPDLRIVEYSGLSTTNPVDVVASAVGYSATTDSGTVTTSNANDLLFASNYVANGTTGPGTGFTQRIITDDFDIVEDRIVTSTGAYNATAPHSAVNWWVMQMVAFKSAVAADTQAPTVPTGLSATAASSTQVNLSWTASTDNIGVTGYFLERCTGASCSTFAQIGTPTTTSYSDTGLTGSTSYSYRVRATDAAGNLSGYSSTASATTQGTPDTQAPTAPAGLTATAASSTQINLSWTASTDNVAVTNYLIERCSGASCTTFAQVSTSLTTTYNDTGLTASTSYRYRVRTTDAAANLSGYSGIASATTQAPPDTQAPTAPSGLTITAASSTQINLSWSASTDNVAVTGYLVERCTGASCTSYAQIATPTTTTLVDTGLAAATSYSYRVRATDAAANLSAYSSVGSATTQAPADTQAPTAPTGLVATAASSTQINLSWTASTDNVGVTGYRVERCQGASCTTFAQIATPTATSYSDTGLTGSTNYSYRVRAVDAAGNLGGYSSTASATTVTPPTVPTGLSVIASSQIEIDLTWSPASSGTGVAGYRLERCQGVGCSSFTQIAAPTSTTYYDMGLTAATSYSYRVRAIDTAGNLGGYSGVLTVSTLSAGTGCD